MIRYVNAAICIAPLPPASWLAVEAPSALLLLPFLFLLPLPFLLPFFLSLSLSLSLCVSPSPPPLAHIFWICAANPACVWVCVPAQGCSHRYCNCYRSVSLREKISKWRTCAHLAQLAGCHQAIAAAAVRHGRQVTLGFNSGTICLDILRNPWKRSVRTTLNVCLGFCEEIHFPRWYQSPPMLAFSLFLAVTLSGILGVFSAEMFLILWKCKKQRHWDRGSWSKLGFPFCCLNDSFLHFSMMVYMSSSDWLLLRIS